MYLAAATHPFINSLEHVMGFFLVLFALLLLWAITLLIGQVFKSYAAPAVATPAPESSPGSAPGNGEGPSEEEVAAIAATVVSLMGRRSRIVSIRSTTKDWHREGRREHFASHKIR
ncbi:MAG: OadG family transporter subunit [Oceanipulchritudo sp.]